VSRPIRDIVIVGGGTTGWLAAALLNHRLQWGFAHPEGVRITVIESPEIPTVGVGEATIPGIRVALETLEICEKEFFARTHATFKLGVRFDDWHRPGGPKRASFTHPFSGGVQVGGRNPTASLLAYGLPEGVDIDPEVGNVVGNSIAAIEALKSPKRPDDPPYQGILGYAYHVDAGLFAQFLRDVAVARGVQHVPDTVVGVELGDRGHVAALQLEQGGRRPVELVIDCSGFRGLVINEALGEPFISYAPYLPNDRAVAVQVAHGEDSGIAPITTATARDHGWQWRIPLQSRIGTGYVFSSSFIGEAAATDALTASVAGQRMIVEPRTLKMRVGRCRRSWVANCVAMGLASGFVEPLESTSISAVDFACRRLLQCLPSLDFEPGPIAKFNQQMNMMYEEIVDFLGLHFTLGDRDDTPYWRAQHHEVKRSDRLEECLAIWRHSLPDIYDPRTSWLFSPWSVNAVLLGKGYYAGGVPVGSDLLPEAVWNNYIRHFVKLRAGIVGALPDHRETLRAMVAAAVPGESAARLPRRDAAPRAGMALGPSVPVMSPDTSLLAAGGMR
jgi:tryptophan halogenase